MSTSPDTHDAQPPHGRLGREARLLVLLLFCFGFCALFHAINQLVAVGIRANAQTCALAGTHVGFNCPGGQPHAPDAYRTLMPAVYHKLEALVPSLDHSRVEADVDGLLLITAFYFLFDIALLQARGPVLRQWAAAAFALAMMVFPLYWIFPLYRAETAVSTLFVAVSMWSLQRFPASGIGTLFMVCAAIIQSFARTDVVAALGAALLLGGLLPAACGALGGRNRTLFRGAALVGIAVGVQAYLQLVRFPHLHYEAGTQVIMLWTNLHLHFLTMIVVVVGPYVVLAVLAWRTGFALRGLDLVVALATIIEFVLWISLGSGAEPRILVPFLFACVPVAGRIAVHLAESPLAASETPGQPL